MGAEGDIMWPAGGIFFQWPEATGVILTLQRRPRNRAMDNRSTRLFVQNLVSTERNEGLLHENARIIVQDPA